MKPASLLTGAGAARRARIRSALHRHCPCEPLEPRRLMASVAGIAFQDDNGNNVRDAGELALTGRTVYIDADNDHRLGAAERAFITGPDGAYRFDGLAASNQFLGQVVPAGWKKSTAVAVVGLAEGATARYDLGSVASPPPTLVLDPSFGNGGQLDLPFFTAKLGNVAKAVAVAEQPDGKLIVGYEETQFGTLRIQRFAADGTLDVPFSDNARVAAETQLSNSIQTRAVAVLPDGKILVAGGSYERGFFTVARFNPDGTLDTTFGTDGLNYQFVTDREPGPTSVSDLLVQTGGRIVVVGESSGNLVAAGFTPAGARDTTFGTSGVAKARPIGSDPYGIGPAGALAPDGRIVAAASPAGRNGTTVVRWTADGKPDTTFGVGGIAVTSQADFEGLDVAVQPDGAIVLGGSSHPSVAFGVARLMPDGTPDASFGAGGYAVTSIPPGISGSRASGANALTLLADGRILAAGAAQVATPLSDVAFVRYTPGGLPDPTFNGGVRRATLGPGNEFVQQVIRTRGGATLALATVDDFSRAALLKLVDKVPDPITLDANGTLTVFGTGAKDTIIITRSGDTVSVALNNDGRDFDAAAVRNVSVSALAGDDFIATQGLTVPVDVLGGEGADWLDLGGTDSGDAVAVGYDTATRGGVVTGFYNVETLWVEGGAGADTFTYAGSPGAGPLTNLELLSGDDAVTVTRGDPGRRLTIHGGPGNDSVTVVADADPSRSASLTFDGEAGSDRLDVRGTSLADAITVDRGAFSGAGSGSTTSVETVLVEGLGGNDVLNLVGSNGGAAATLDAGPGDDVINLGDDTNGLVNLTGSATLVGGSGNDTVHADDRAYDDYGNVFEFRPGWLRLNVRNGAKFTYSQVEDFVVDGGSGNDVVIATPSSSTTFTFNAGAPVLTDERGGDILRLAYDGAAGMVRTNAGPGAGQYTFTNRKPIRFDGFETIDDLKPQVVSSSIDLGVAATGPTFTYLFNKDVALSVDSRDIVITNADTGQVWAATPNVVYDQASRTGRFHYAQQPPPGRYVATLVGAGINDDAGNTLSPDRVITFAVTAAVIRRLAFYNGSKYDGNDSAANALDDAAIPPNKAALLPGQTGSFANLISDPAGITGVMIDVDHVPPGVTLTPDDFVTRVGLAGVDPSAWAAGPAPSLVAVRRGAGTGGSDRVTLIWPDNSIRNTWLQVTMKADERTGLARPDVFYLASLVGERGSVSDLLDTYRVDATDLAGVKAALNTDASIINTVDFNRDGRVNALDLGAAKSNLNRSLERLRAPLASAAPSGAAPSFVAPALGEPGAAVGRVWDEQLPGLLG